MLYFLLNTPSKAIAEMRAAAAGPAVRAVSPVDAAPAFLTGVFFISISMESSVLLNTIRVLFHGQTAQTRMKWAFSQIPRIKRNKL